MINICLFCFSHFFFIYLHQRSSSSICIYNYEKVKVPNLFFPFLAFAEVMRVQYRCDYFSLTLIRVDHSGTYTYRTQVYTNQLCGLRLFLKLGMCFFVSAVFRTIHPGKEKIKIPIKNRKSLRADHLLSFGFLWGKIKKRKCSWTKSTEV